MTQVNKNCEDSKLGQPSTSCRAHYTHDADFLSLLVVVHSATNRSSGPASHATSACATQMAARRQGYALRTQPCTLAAIHVVVLCLLNAPCDVTDSPELDIPSNNLTSTSHNITLAVVSPRTAGRTERVACEQ